MRNEILKRQDPEINEILKNAKVSILGCGGLGSNIAMVLARSGLGEIYIYDYDKVELSNLNRQNYDQKDLGKSKVFQTKKKIEETIPYAKVFAKEVLISKENLSEIAEKTDVFIEAFDKKEMKSLVFEYFLGRNDKKLIMASGLSGLGDFSDIKVKKIENVTMVGDFKSSQVQGLYAPYLGIVANIEALLALKVIIGERNGK
ncbi:sulfur carrier protein ThiS adenylyltransferase ThiF [uncultured Anaerococcus sp.]|uniref:sulfur carrier protein ThiS adenylyltransferase ThiF n=1 Tax=uncultured Anaerococcus sp. TaxID=293428 RepID=UPI0028894EF8|nr:sulfur carrier protein ThiS adenylyltransferase ThiF [uncultured Anaerococcus sp.]